MADEDREKGSTIRIVDKRRFDLEGHERGDADGGDVVENEIKPASVKGSVAQADSAKTTKPIEKPSVENETTDFVMEDDMGEPSPEQEITFSSFVVSLATQALMQLGQIKPPPGVNLPVDPMAAKQTIDILTVLQIKTRGNLDAEEDRLLEEVLHSLRIGYVKAAK